MVLSGKYYKVGGIHATFGGSIGIVDRAGHLRCFVHSLAAETEVAERGMRPLSDEHAQGCGIAATGDAVGIDETVYPLHIMAHLIGHEKQGSSHGEHGEEVFYRGIE